jgi:hypothetical protein
MSRILMALGVVAALSVFSTEPSAAPLFPYPPPPPPAPPALPGNISVPGNICKDTLFGANNASSTHSSFGLPNSIQAEAPSDFPQTIICPLVRHSSSNPIALVTLIGNSGANNAECDVLSTDGNNFLYGSAPIFVSGPPASVSAPPNAVLSVECTNFHTGYAIYGFTVSF